MPSVMVLVLGKDSSLASVADSVVAGAKSVRYTEVTTRAMEPGVFRYRVLDTDATPSPFDGIVVVASEEETTASLEAALAGLSRHTARVDTVLAQVGGGSALMAKLVATGGIFVAPPGETADDRAHATGGRVATVAGWVRHALGHEAAEKHGHHDHHEHDHNDQHRHDHGHRH